MDLDSINSETELPTPWEPASSLRLIGQKAFLVFLMLAALLALMGLLSTLWSQAPSKGSRVVLLVGFGLMFWLPLFQIGMAWYLNLRFRLREPVAAPEGLSVDVYVTTFNEPLDMIESSLRAALGIRYPHETYVLDDGRREEVRALAEELGVHYLSRTSLEDRKAGNVNHALDKTSGEFVAIFDLDHHARPDFLDRSLGYFSDPEVGFVQVMNTFSNAGENIFARAACETAYQYYNIGAVGKDTCRAASLMGSNAVIRREALLESGKYQPGLAEDLETSLALHSHGWKSAYVRQTLAPGHAPADLLAFFKQQLKWSSGVFTAALSSFTGRFWRLDPQQKLCYLTRFTYYLHGALVPLHMLGLTVLLVWPVFDIEAFSRGILPFTFLGWLSAGFLPLRMWALEPRARRGFLFRGSSLFMVTWPFYTAAVLSTLMGRKVPFIATPKAASSHFPWWTIAPQAVVFLLLLVAAGWRLANWSVHPMPVTLAFAAFLLSLHWILIPALVQRGRKQSVRDEPPTTIAVSRGDG